MPLDRLQHQNNLAPARHINEIKQHVNMSKLVACAGPVKLNAVLMLTHSMLYCVPVSTRTCVRSQRTIQTQLGSECEVLECEHAGLQWNPIAKALRGWILGQRPGQSLLGHGQAPIVTAQASI